MKALVLISSSSQKKQVQRLDTYVIGRCGKVVESILDWKSKSLGFSPISVGN